MEVRKKRPRGFKKEAQGIQASPLNPLSVAPCHARAVEEAIDQFVEPAARFGPAQHCQHVLVSLGRGPSVADFARARLPDESRLQDSRRFKGVCKPAA